MTDHIVAFLPVKYDQYRFWQPAMESMQIDPRKVPPDEYRTFWQEFQRKALEAQGVQFVGPGFDPAYEQVHMPSDWYIASGSPGMPSTLTDGHGRIHAYLFYGNDDAEPTMSVLPRFSCRDEWLPMDAENRPCYRVGIFDGETAISTVDVTGLAKPTPPSDLPEATKTQIMDEWVRSSNVLEDQIRGMIGKYEKVLAEFFPMWWDPAQYWNAQVPLELRRLGG